VKGEREQEKRKASDFLAAVDAAGRKLDFHGLRHSFVSRLIKAGVRPKNAQLLARHSTIGLTMDRYTHVGLHDVAAALNTLPCIPESSGKPEPQTLRMTGTDGDSACTPACTKLVSTAASSRRRMMTNAETTPSNDQPGGEQKALEMLGDDDTCEDMLSGGAGIRTLERLSALPVFKTGAIDHSATPPTHLVLDLSALMSYPKTSKKKYPFQIPLSFGTGDASATETSQEKDRYGDVLVHESGGRHLLR
jgi:hypothetical protein